jgi:hypothetical protein
MSSKILTHLSELSALDEITMGSVVNKLEEEALLIVSLVSIIPFLQPIPIPGLSTILGFIVLLQGVGMVFIGKPLLTDKMKRVTIPKERYNQIYRGIEKILRFTDRIAIFRHPWVSSRASRIICGLSMISTAAFLSLPLPIPMSNFVPALSIALVCIGLLEEDLILTIFGLGISFAVLWMAVMSYHLMREQFQSWL